MSDVASNHRFLSQTRSLCPRCFQTVKTMVVEHEGKVWLKKHCPEHGDFETLHLVSDPKMYEFLTGLHAGQSGIPEGLLINVTYRCNQFCPYCFARAQESVENESTQEDILSLVDGFSGDIIYLCGGEPTLREDLFEIISKIKRKGFRVMLFTNGKKLVSLRYAQDLKTAGVDGVILQFDSMDDDDYVTIRGESLLSVKKKAIANLSRFGIYIMLYVNIVEHVNEDQIKGIFAFALQNPCVKILFYNPLWNIGRRQSSSRLSPWEVLALVQEKLGIDKYYFMQSIRFSTLIFELMRKGGLKKGIKQPPCSISCYLIRTRDGYVRFDSLFDLDRVNQHLEALNKSFVGRYGMFELMRVITKHHFLCIVVLLLNRKTVGLFMKGVAAGLKAFVQRHDLFFMFFDVLSIMVGQFPDVHSLDLSLAKACNMHTAVDSSSSMPTCLYEILRDAKMSKRDLETEEEGR